MPADNLKHPSRYPIWMRQAIESAIAIAGCKHGNTVYAVQVKDAAHEKSLRREFRACVKSLRLNGWGSWGPGQLAAMRDHDFRLWRHEHAMYLQATPGRGQRIAEREELAQRLAQELGASINAGGRGNGDTG